VDTCTTKDEICYLKCALEIFHVRVVVLYQTDAIYYTFIYWGVYLEIVYLTPCCLVEFEMSLFDNIRHLHHHLLCLFIPH